MAKKTGEKYQAIIDAAVRVISRYGYHNARVSLIAREANVADGTIYLYFTSKDDILISVFNEKMGQFIESCRRQIHQTASVEEKLYVLLQAHLGQLARDPEMAVVTQIELRQSNPVVSQGIGEVLKSYFHLIDEIVSQGIEQGVFHPWTDVRIARQVIFGTLDQAATAWVMKKCKYDLTAQAGPIHDAILHGLKRRAE